MNGTYRKSPFPLRLDDEVEMWAKDQARSNERSLNWWINQILKSAKTAQEANHAKPA